MPFSPTPPSTGLSSKRSARMMTPRSSPRYIKGTLNPPSTSRTDRKLRFTETGTTVRIGSPRCVKTARPLQRRQRVKTLNASERGLLQRGENETRRAMGVDATGYTIRAEQVPSDKCVVSTTPPMGGQRPQTEKRCRDLFLSFCNRSPLPGISFPMSSNFR